MALNAAPTAFGLDESTSWLHLLGDRTRVRLLSLLERNELSVAELTKITQLGQSRVSTHLGKLKEGGLVIDRKVGASSRYRLRRDMPEGAAALWRHLRSSLDDAQLREDRTRLEARGEEWAERVAGEMERHYSPGRTWESFACGLAALGSHGAVLDIGCGDGFTGRLIGEHCTRYVGIDTSPRIVEAAQRRLEGLAQHEVRIGDMHALPVEDATFDVVLLFHTLVFADDPRRAIAEAARALRAGGRLVITTLAAHEHGATTRPYGHRNDGFEESALRGLLLQAGLTPVGAFTRTRERSAPHFESLSVVAFKVAAERT